MNRMSRLRIAGMSVFALLLVVASIGQAADHTIRIARHDCDRLVDYVPAPDVAYQPAVDVDGRPVGRGRQGRFMPIWRPAITRSCWRRMDTARSAFR